MLQKALFPGKYIQGAGAIGQLPELVKLFGRQGLILATPTAFEKILPASGIDLKAERFNGERCEAELSRLAAIISENKLDLLAGLQLTDALPEESDTVYTFCEQVGLPTTLADLGLKECDRSRLLQVAEKACAPIESIHHEAGAITPDKVLHAILAADAIGQRRNRQQC